MAVCDICGTPGVGTTIGAEDMRQAVFGKGFNPYALGLMKSVAGMASAFGMRDSELYEGWRNTVVAQDTSDWNICPSCMASLQPYLAGAPRPTGIAKATVSADPMVGAVMGAMSEDRYQTQSREAPPGDWGEGGAIYCSRCGVANPHSARFCASCGAPIAAAQANSRPGSVPVSDQQTYRPQVPYQQAYPTGAPASHPVRASVPTYVGWAIACFFLCFWPTAIVALVYAGRVNKRLALGDYDGAVRASRGARTWCWVSFGILIAAIVIAIIASAA